MGDELVAPDAIADLPPSCKLVFKVLEYEGRLSHDALRSATYDLSDPTIREAVRRLEDADAIERLPHHDDLRSNTFAIKSDGK